MTPYRHIKRWVSISALIAFVSLSQGVAADMISEADGRGTTEAAALLDAKRSAVEKGIGSLLISQTEIENFELKRDLILTRTVGAVKTYEVLKKVQNPDNTFYVKIRATVSTSSIKDDLVAMQILLESMDKPRLMVLIDEPNSPTVQSALVDYLKGKGFELVDRGLSTSSATVANDALAAKIGKEGGAEFVIIGRASKTTGKGAFGMVSGQVSLSIRVVNCSTARIISSKSKNASFAHMDSEQALAKASERAANAVIDDSLFEELIASFQNTVNNGATLELTVNNVKNYKMQKQINATLASLPETVSVTKRSFTKGTLSLSVVYKGSADSLCDSIDGKSLANGTISVTDTTGNRIVLEVEM